jgi:hypothetical protein
MSEKDDDLDIWIEKNFPSKHIDFSGGSFSRPGRHGKKVNGEFVGRRLNEAYEMGAIDDDEP